MADCFQKREAIFEKTLTGKYVSVKTLDSQIHYGYVYVMDPETKTVVLSNDDDLTIIPAASITDLVIDINMEIKNISFKSTGDQCFESEDLDEKRRKLKSWLNANFIDVVEDGCTLKFHEGLLIEPPYDVEHCYCSNTIILDRIRNLISKMP